MSSFIDKIIEIEQSKLDCALCEHCVVICHMVSAFVVVLISAVVVAVGFIPDVCKLCHRCGLLFVELFDESGIYCSAVSVDSALVNFQGIGNQLFVACHDVCEVAERLRCMSVRSDVNVNVMESYS